MSSTNGYPNQPSGHPYGQQQQQQGQYPPQIPQQQYYQQQQQPPQMMPNASYGQQQQQQPQAPPTMQPQTMHMNALMTAPHQQPNLDPNNMTHTHQMQQPQMQQTQHQFVPPAAGLSQETPTPSSSAAAAAQAQQTAETAARMATTAAEGAKQKLKGLFRGRDPQGPNLGFKPTAAMAQRHEDALVSGKRPLFQFQVTKLRTWRTGYTRLLCLYDDHFSTVDPDSHEITNTWSFGLLSDFMAVEKDQFLLQVESDKLKFQCHNVDRSLVLTSLLQCLDDHAGGSKEGDKVVLCNRWTRHGHVVPSALRLTPYALVEVHPVTRKHIQTYRYVDIGAVSFLSDDPTGLVLHLKTTQKKRLFCVANQSLRADLVMGMRQHQDRIGLELQMTDSCTRQQWKDGRRDDQRPSSRNRASPVIATEWQVTKVSKRHDSTVVGTNNGWPGGVMTRRLCLAGNGLLMEMDTARMIVSIRQLSTLYAIVRPSTEGDTLVLEYSDGHAQRYASQSRDSLLVSLLDAATTLGKNPKVQVSDVRSGGYCLASFSTLAALEKGGGLFQPISIPLHCLKRVHAVGTAAFSYMNVNTESSTEEGVPINPIDECRNVMEICREFNASVLPTAEGLPVGEKDKLVLGSAGSLWGLVAWLLEWKKDRHLAEQTAGPLLQTLHRLSKTPAGYKNSIELATCLDCVPLLLTIDDAFTKFWAFRTMTVLLSGIPGKRDNEVEYVNKSVIFKAGGAQLVHGLVGTLLDLKVSDLIRMVMSDILQSVLCSYADTTSPEVFSAFIQALGENYQALLNTLYQQTPFVLENSALLLHLLSTHAPSVAASIREAALASGVLLHHFHAAIFSRMAGQRFLSRFLCSLWLAGPMDCDEKKLLKRMVPMGFIPYLKMPQLSRTEEEQLDVIEQDAVEENIPEESNGTPASGLMVGSGTPPTGAAGTNTARLRSRISLSRSTSNAGRQESSSENFRIFFHTLTQDHALPDLIWNQQTRRELRIGLESEIQYIHRETEARGMDKVAWNHQQYFIEYPSLDNELRVGSVYMRLWLQAGEGFIKSWDEPLRLFELLFRRFLCEMDRNTKVTVMCIRCLERLYAIHGDSIGAFPDVMILIRSMASTRNTETQHRLLGLLATILGVYCDSMGDEGRVNVPENAEQLLNFESIEQLCQFAAWGHTNGVQVGNLMTSLLDSSLPKSVLLTDGTTTKPNDISNPSPGILASNIPAVWFVASTHKIPPPLETIKGPFRLAELQTMMESGEISQFTLVTSTHVESYDEEDKAADSSVDETQIDTGKWKRLDQIWQLRWQLCTDGDNSGIYTPSEVSLQALQSLTRLVDLHRSLDSRGLPYFPIPIAKRIICGLSKDPFAGRNGEASDKRLSFLSILAQSILCNDASVVNQAANMLFKLTQYNEEATSKLYLTGVFFFMACYTGSNFNSLANLMHLTHLEQHFRSGYAAAANQDELRLKDRSVLGGLLPEGILFILVNYGADRFNDVFVGNCDTPEVIWNLEMRKHLIEMVRQHLGDFPKRLWQNTTIEYEYCPMPGVAYKRLEKEIFCHNYYLSNLCDERRFPDWPISEPVEVFRACLEEFKKQMNRDGTEEEEALEGATKVLNLKPGDGSKELRKTYRELALKYHPDRNPAGREMFEAVQGAYELLLPIIESGQELKFFPMGEGRSNSDGAAVGGPDSAEGFAGGRSQMETLQLLIKTQILICKRFEAEMGKYKYPAYPLLLSCLKLTSASEEARSSDGICRSAFLMESRALFIRDTVELTFRTCLVSPLNAEELVSESGVTILDSILDYYIFAASLLNDIPGESQGVASDDEVYEIIAIAVHTLAGIAYYESGRLAIESLPNLDQFCINWRRCIDGKHMKWRRQQPTIDTSIKKFALEGIANMARSTTLQNALIGAGVIWPLGRFLLGFDPTLDEGSASRENLDDDVGVSQASSNSQGRLAARALGMLSGYLQDPKLATPANAELQAAMSTILTSPVALLLRNKRTGEILRTLNTNVESPSRIWNVNMRAELLKIIATMEEKRPENKTQSVAEELNGLSGFEYSALKNEMQIGGIYVRVFNKLGLERGGLRDVPNPGLFAKQLTEYIARCINHSNDLPEAWIGLPVSESSDDESAAGQSLATVSIVDRRFIAILSALRILVRADGLIDDVLCQQSTGIPSVLLSFLEMPHDSEAFDIGCDILSLLSSKQPFADAVAAESALWRLLSVLERPSGSDDAPDPDDSTDSTADILRKQKGWSLLESLSSSPSVAQKIVDSSAWLELLGILVGYSNYTKIYVGRIGAAKTLSRLLWDPKMGQAVAPLLKRFLPKSLVVMLKEEGPETMLKLFDGESDTPELIWDSSMRNELRKVAAQELDACMQNRSQDESGKGSFLLDPSICVKYSKLDSELFIGGVYVTRFLKEPTYNLRDPTSFLEMLLQRWSHELQLRINHPEINGEEKHSTDVVVGGGQDNIQLVTDAIVYICKVRTNLCDKLAQWGYMSRCLSFLESVLDRDLLGTPLLSVMRVLHVAVNRRVNVESIIASGSNDRTHGIIALTMSAVGGENSLHPDTGFMLEMLKKVFVDALGDVEKAKSMAPPQETQPTSPAGRYAMAPSPAPGDGRVVRNRITTGNPLDDPLSLGMAASENPNVQMEEQQEGGLHGSQAMVYAASPGISQMPSQGSQAGSYQIPDAGYQSYQFNSMYGSNPYNQMQRGVYQGQQAVPQAPIQLHGSGMPTTTNGYQPASYGQQQQQQQQQQRMAYGASPLPQIPTLQPQTQQPHHQSSSSHISFAQRSAMAQQQMYGSQPDLQQQSPMQHQQGVPRMYGQANTQHYGQSSAQTLPQGQTTTPHTASQLRQPLHGRPQQIQGNQASYQQPPQVTTSFATPSPAPSQTTMMQRGLSNQQPDSMNYGFEQSYATGAPSSYVATQQPRAGKMGNPASSQFQQPPSNIAYQQAPSTAGGTAITGLQGTPYSNFQHAVNGQVLQPPVDGTAPVVETVQPGMDQDTTGEAMQPSAPSPGVHQAPAVTVGSGVDARTKPEPAVEAAQKAATSHGAPGCADGRKALLESAIRCDLAAYLVDSVLENATLVRVKDPASVKVHSVELLKLLTQDPGYGMKFQLILEKLPAWKKYVSQDHSLFITGPDQKTDYFLTDGGSDPKKLLTQG